MDEPQVSGGGSFVPVSINDKPPAAVIPNKNRELKRVVSPLNFSCLPSTELDRSRASPGIRSPGLTTNRSGQIVQSGTLQRQTYMNSSARNKSSDHLVPQASTPVSQSPTVASGTLNKNNVGNGQEGTLTGRDAVSVNDVSRRAATLDRSWRTKESDLGENLPRVGGNFSFDLERDVLGLLDLISEFEENGVDGIRFNSTPLSPGFESGQNTVIRRTAQQKPSSSGQSLRTEQVACDVSGFNEKHVLPQKVSVESPGFSKASSGNQIAHPKFDEVSVRSQKVDDRLPESHNTLHKVAIGASKAYTTPDWSQELPNGTTMFDQTSILSKKFSVAGGDPPGPPHRGEFNGAILYPDVGNNGVPYSHGADPILKLVSTSGGHIGVSAQRGYASDSEDPMNWLEQQRAKLNMKKFYRESTKRDPRLVQELKIRQRFLGRIPVDKKESLGYSTSSDGTQHSKIAAQSPELYYRESGHEFPTSSDLNASWSDSYTHRQNISDQVVGAPSRSSVGTPDPDQNHRGGHFPKDTQSPGHVSRSLSLPRYANGVTVSDNSSTACNLSLTPTTYYTNAGCAKQTNTTSPSSSSSDQPEVHETCISKKIIPQHRGYSPTRLDALIEAAAVATECESSPSSSRSTEISDSGYRTASASSTNDESPLTNTAQKMSNSSAREIPRTTNGQAGVDFEMALPDFRHQLASSNSSSKINGNLNYERFNPQSRHPTAANQFELPGITVPKQFQRFPMVDPQQFFPTAQQCPTYAKAAATSGLSGNPRRAKTLEEEIEDLLAFGEQLKQKDGHRPTDKSQLPLQDQRRQFVGVQEPFGYTSSSGVSHQNPISPTEGQKQMLRITGSQDPASSMANPLTSHRQPMNGNLSNDQLVRTTTDVGLPTETRIFNQLHVETYQPNRMLVEPSYQRKESQTTNGGFDPNRDNQPDLRDQDLFVRLPFSMNSHTLPNNVTRHETVNQSRNAEQQIPANQQYAGECNRIGPTHTEKGTSEYTATVQVNRSHPSRQSANANTNYIGSSWHEFQGRKTNGVGFNGFEYQSSVRSGNEPRISEENHHDCVILYSEDGRQVLIPKNCLDVTTTAPQSMTSPTSVSPLAAVPEHRAENVSNKVVRDVAAHDSRFTQQQMGQRVATAAGGEAQLMDRYGGTIAPESYTIRRQVSAGTVPQQQQQQFGSTRVETVRSESTMAQMPSATDSMQRRQFNSQNSDSVFRSPPPEAVSINQVAAHLRGEVSRTSSFSSSVTGQSSPSLSVDRSSGGSASSTRVVDGVDVSPQYVMQCVRDAYKEWYKPEMTRDEVVNFLKDKPPGSFIIRNSTSYVGDFALAVKVSEIPLQIQQRTGDLSEEFVRHFLIESKPSGIRLKGRSNEPLFASLTSFVFQHALTPLSLPHRLLLPTSPDTSSVGSRTGSLSRSSTSASMSKAQDEISSMLIYIGAVDLETLTGPEALEKAVSQIVTQNTSPVTTTVVNFILSSQGIVLTDTKRKLFFRRHYPLSCISYCGIDTGDRRWTEEVDGSKKNTERRIFGFVSRKRGSSSAGSQSSPGGNECHLFADYETGYPAERVVDLINKILGENGYNVFN